ncbi:MAG: DNA-3-methyladenine glycosylase [Lachnospiraceae bacterium]|nr:DNA-3-methyladenine glycosylase [Lachnospiraceae bacterium]
MGKRLLRRYYSQPATVLAADLIGKLLCRRTDAGILKYRIAETECYYREQDTACHASKGKTERTKVLYEKGGTAYVYLCYGIHSLFNVVTGKEGFPEAVLIRGVEDYNGPGKVTKAMSIDRSLNGIDLVTSKELWIEDDGVRPEYTAAKRVGIDYATPEYRDVLWRYIIKDGRYKAVQN